MLRKGRANFNIFVIEATSGMRFSGYLSIPQEFLQIFVRQKLLPAEPERVVRNDLQIAVQELLVGLCLEAVRRDEKFPAAAGHAVSGCYAYFVVA